MKAVRLHVNFVVAILLSALTLTVPSSSGQAQEPKPDTPNQAENGREKEKKNPLPKLSENPIRVTKYPFYIPPSEEYVIGPDDVLAINVWREPEVSRTVPVRPDGKISLPLIGELRVNGLTPLQVEEYITEKLQDFMSNPEVTVIVQNVNSHKFNIVGEVARPGSYHFSKPMTVLDAIAAAGGFSGWAKTKKIYVLRRLDNGSRITIPFNYNEVVKGKKFYQNVELEPGDTIVVP